MAADDTKADRLVRDYLARRGRRPAAPLAARGKILERLGLLERERARLLEELAALDAAAAGPAPEPVPGYAVRHVREWAERQAARSRPPPPEPGPLPPD